MKNLITKSLLLIIVIVSVSTTIVKPATAAMNATYSIPTVKDQFAALLSKINNDATYRKNFVYKYSVSPYDSTDEVRSFYRLKNGRFASITSFDKTKDNKVTSADQTAISAVIVRQDFYGKVKTECMKLIRRTDRYTVAYDIVDGNDINKCFSAMSIRDGYYLNHTAGETFTLLWKAMNVLSMSITAVQ